ncbi:MAG: hypothetical protein P0Y53_02410 [Candidatus Pseudobacter hemicellulosilyticus]|uniref:Uncharacterized protein n=1 Tax=Candidatus Pseudobacter hemicellulosilyticus TaxID=3121375 RepID=A0AAJ5WQJ7_9BACT|nr:MAG: hypothetical protein P0Y53_02410 [Pseudobacter sp.]
MRKLLLIIGVLLLFLLLTILTQVGGIAYLLSLLAARYINKLSIPGLYKKGLAFAGFLLLYAVISFGIVPLIARSLGRVPLPVRLTRNVQPGHAYTWLLNRHYGTPALKETLFQVAEEMNQAFPGTTLVYLDGNFPFFDGFPLVPHLSHNDGKKLDLSFYYLDKQTGKPGNISPAPLGYGFCEEPRKGEINTAAACAAKGAWQYSFMQKIVPDYYHKQWTFDSIRTKALVQQFANNRAVEKIFLEPHLKARLHLTENKIRFHGCQAVRHDDHVHIQVR